MTELTIFSTKYAALIFLLAIMVWRFWGKVEGVLLLTALGFFGYNQCSRIEVPSIISNSSIQERKKEIIAFSQMTIDETAGEMYNRKLLEKNEGNVLIYPADMKKDYYKFFTSNPGKFIIAFSDGGEYEDFFKSIDSLMVEGKKAVECPEGKAYQLASECFVCKTGFLRQYQRFILSVSRNLNFSIPNSTLPKRTPKPVDSHPAEPIRKSNNLPPIDFQRNGDDSKWKFRPMPKKDSTNSGRTDTG